MAKKKAANGGAGSGGSGKRPGVKKSASTAASSSALGMQPEFHYEHPAMAACESLQNSMFGDLIASFASGKAKTTAKARNAAAPPSAGDENIVGFGVGLKVVGGRITTQQAIHVFVKEKQHHRNVRKSHLIPSEHGGFPTDIIEVGPISAFAHTGPFLPPVPCGSSVGHPNNGSGTIGCLVELVNGKICMLSNNHVLANVNNAGIGDSSFHPGMSDFGPRSIVGQLENFIPILLDGRNNVIDAAVAEVVPGLVSPRHHNGFQINPTPVAGSQSMTVHKCGRTTEETTGTIFSFVQTAFQISYGPNNGPPFANFISQFAIIGSGNPFFSQPGDSGSLIVEANTMRPTALLFAGGSHRDIGNGRIPVTFATPIQEVMRFLGIRRFISA